MNPDTTVYLGARGKCWHLSPKCAGDIHSVVAKPLSHGIHEGKPCRVCVSEDARAEAREVLGV